MTDRININNWLGFLILPLFHRCVRSEATFFFFFLEASGHQWYETYWTPLSPPTYFSAVSRNEQFI